MVKKCSVVSQEDLRDLSSSVVTVIDYQLNKLLLIAHTHELPSSCISQQRRYAKSARTISVTKMQLVHQLLHSENQVLKRNIGGANALAS